MWRGRRVLRGRSGGCGNSGPCSTRSAPSGSRRARLVLLMPRPIRPGRQSGSGSASSRSVTPASAPRDPQPDRGRAGGWCPRLTVRSVGWTPPAGADVAAGHERPVLDTGGAVLRYGHLLRPRHLQRREAGAATTADPRDEAARRTVECSVLARAWSSLPRTAEWRAAPPRARLQAPSRSDVRSSSSGSRVSAVRTAAVRASPAVPRASVPACASCDAGVLGGVTSGAAVASCGV
jgi:hypothetical protein